MWASPAPLLCTCTSIKGMWLMSAPCITHVYDDFDIKINKIEDIFPEIFFPNISWQKLNSISVSVTFFTFWKSFCETSHLIPM